MEIVFEKLPLTLALAFLGIGLAFVFSIPLGIIAALKPGGISDRGTVFVSLIGLSVPQFWLGLLLIVVFAVQLGVAGLSPHGNDHSLFDDRRAQSAVR
jgi:peptide/nickel transport system permease protein